jgi:hypothetical protein
MIDAESELRGMLSIKQLPVFMNISVHCCIHSYHFLSALFTNKQSSCKMISTQEADYRGINSLKRMIYIILLIEINIVRYI